MSVEAAPTKAEMLEKIADIKAGILVMSADNNASAKAIIRNAKIMRLGRTGIIYWQQQIRLDDLIVFCQTGKYPDVEAHEYKNFE